MNKDDILLPLFLEALRLNPAVDAGAALAELVRGKGNAATALAFLPFFGWGKKAKKGSQLVKRVAQHVPEAEAASKLKAAERAWMQGLGGALRPATPLPLGRLPVGSSMTWMDRFPADRNTARLAEEVWANFKRHGGDIADDVRMTSRDIRQGGIADDVRMTANDLRESGEDILLKLRSLFGR